MIEEIIFSKTLKIYKTKYNWEHSQSDIFALYIFNVLLKIISSIITNFF